MMVETRKIKLVEDHTQSSGDEYWHVYVELEDGRTWVHVMPKEAFEWRAAEYSIDPSDVDALLDSVLYDGLIPDPRRKQNFEDDAAAKKGMVVANPKNNVRGVKLGEQVPIWLYNAPSPGHAKKAHLERVKAAKERVKFVPHESLKAAGDPLDVIRADIPNHVDPEMVKVKAEYVNEHRKMERGEQCDMKRIKEIRQTLRRRG
jgi:hypothetical protein